MTDKTTHSDVIDEIRQKASGFKAEIPAQAWNRIESRLDDNHTKRQISFYKLFYNAAIFLLLIGVISFISIYLFNQKETQSVDNYAQNIQELKITNNSYPVYNVHQLQKAYMRLESVQPPQNALN